MNPNATITIEDPRQLTWSATVQYPHSSFWLAPGSTLTYPKGSSRHEIDEADPMVLAKRLRAAVQEGFQVLKVHACVDAKRIGSWGMRYMLGGERAGTFGLKLYGDGKGVTELRDAAEAFAAIVRTHSHGWHLQPDGSYVWIDPS